MQSIKLRLPGADDFFTEEAYKVLRTNLQFCGQDVKVIAITSCNENDGKSTIALHVAKSFSELGKKVLVIDADMRKSVIAGRHTSVKGPAGLSEVLSGLEQVTECVYETQIPGLHLMFSGQYPPNPVELLSSSRMKKALDTARKVYDYVILDLPPVGEVTDAMAIAKETDGILLVVRQNYCDRNVLVDTARQFDFINSKILGVVFNCTSEHSGNYGKGYYKHYYKRYYKRYYRGYSKSYENNDRSVASSVPMDKR